MTREMDRLRLKQCCDRMDRMVSKLNSWIDGWKDGWKDGWMMEACIDRWMEQRQNRFMDRLVCGGWKDGWIDGWQDGWRDGWMEGWRDGQMGGWMNKIGRDETG